MSSSRRASSLYVPPQRRSGVAEAASGPSGLSSSARGGGAVQRSLEGEYALLTSAPLPQEESRIQASLPATPTNFPDGSRDSPGLLACRYQGTTFTKKGATWNLKRVFSLAEA
ncbi:hypothetical protein CYMTET_9329 [Cymbomonas tetramitiformis]|uniref:Uncharacterized protein n=1 Tax=Cymbomonas tetramitiformis TaxID=36881 RepID=A0AAE0GRF4_9CHLO|nr:hypothetical protein CYMTET_9329 [Cymbomonas tetramitiformis]